MADPVKDKPLYDAMGYQSSARFWRGLLSNDIGASGGLDPEDVQIERRLVLYRLMLVIMLVAAGTVLVGALFAEPQPVILSIFSGLTTLLLAGSAAQIYLQGRVLLPPFVALALTITTVIWTVSEGGYQQELWLFPLMIALTALLPLRAALVGGGLTLTALVLVQGWQGIGEEMAKHAALFSTWLFSLAIMQLLTRQTDELADLALTDPLTGAFNRRYLLPQTRRHLADFQRYSRLSALLLIDIDYFKSINDEMGHVEGDRVLKALVQLIEGRIRGVDMLFRLGGEEFVVLLSQVGAQTARKIAEELRTKIAAQEVVPGRRVTVSIGVCDVTGVDSAEEWLEQVDRAMYEAKRQGRDRVHLDSPPPRDPSGIEGSLSMWR